VADELAERRYRDYIRRLDRMDAMLAEIKKALGPVKRRVSQLEGDSRQGRDSKKPRANLRSV
jgi:hypothetical protein